MAHDDTRESQLVQHLRAEAMGAKQCFTSFSFQALALAIGTLSLSIGAMKEYPFAAYATLPVIAILMAVPRIGVFKYSSASREYGYELHLARMARNDQDRGRDGTAWRHDWRDIPWEEALRAWRVVQATLFSRIYVTPAQSWLPNHPTFASWIPLRRRRLYRLRPEIQKLVDSYCAQPHTNWSERTPDERGYPWFLPRKLIDASKHSVPGEGQSGEVKAMYHAGSYLRTMLFVLNATQWLMLVPLALRTWDLATPRSSETLSPVALPMLQASTAVHLHLAAIAALLVVIIWRAARVRRRREIIEDELLSIHSCAIVWQAVVMAHYRAVSAATSQHHYTERLAVEAVVLASRPLHLIEWITDPDGDLHKSAYQSATGNRIPAQPAVTPAGVS